MTPEQAAWVRDNVLPREEACRPEPRCACQKDLTAPCRNGNCPACPHGEGSPYPETHLRRYRSWFATGFPTFLRPLVWLADRTCIWRCPCTCHAAVPAQLGLFDMAVA